MAKLKSMNMPKLLEHLYRIKICVCFKRDGTLGKPPLRM